MLSRGLTAAEVARAALEAYDGGPAVGVVAVIEGAEPGRRLLLREDGRAEGSLGGAVPDAAALELARRVLAEGGTRVEAVELEGRRVVLYAEAHRPPEELLIVGAGHIAVPLAQLGATLGYRVTVLDDREEFATGARFPDAARVLRTDFADPFRDVAIGARTHIVLVTRAHKYDFDCLRRLLDGGTPPYIGMIGSRRRVRAALRALLSAGVPRERLARVRAPLGLDIGAETPEEIAVSIAAELVMIRRRGSEPQGGRGVLPLAEKERVLDRLLPEEESDG